MSSKAPKTGLSAQMREWMAKQTRSFSVAQICTGLGIPAGVEHQRVHSAMKDFVVRGEVSRCHIGKRNRRQATWKYRYKPSWKRAVKGPLQATIYKAMYVSGTFSTVDIKKLAAGDEKEFQLSWIGKVVRRLVASGHLQMVGRQVCDHGFGGENLYHIVNRDKFRLEVMR